MAKDKKSTEDKSVQQPEVANNGTSAAEAPARVEHIDLGNVHVGDQFTIGGRHVEVTGYSLPENRPGYTGSISVTVVEY